MKMLKLKKFNRNISDELNEIISDLKNFLNEEADAENDRWNENLKTIIDFQDSNGSFKLYTSYNIPGDAAVDFCCMPTYVCTAILMKSFPDITQKGRAIGAAYLITPQQSWHVARRKNSGREPKPGLDWHGDVIELKEMDGLKAVSLTGTGPRPYNRPIPEYRSTLFNGIRQNRHEMSNEEIGDYLNAGIISAENQ